MYFAASASMLKLLLDCKLVRISVLAETRRREPQSASFFILPIRGALNIFITHVVVGKPVTHFSATCFSDPDVLRR